MYATGHNRSSSGLSALCRNIGRLPRKRINPVAGASRVSPFQDGDGCKADDGASSMSRNRIVWPLLAVAAVAPTCAAAAPAICPSSLLDAGSRHRLVNAALFDGPPSEMADLVPVTAGDVDRWNLDSVDPYLVCRFQGTAEVVTFHAVGARVCEAGKSLFQAYCRN